MGSYNAEAGRTKCTVMVVTVVILARWITGVLGIGVAERATHQGDEGGGIGARRVLRKGG